MLVKHVVIYDFDRWKCLRDDAGAGNFLLMKLTDLRKNSQTGVKSLEYILFYSEWRQRFFILTQSQWIMFDR